MMSLTRVDMGIIGRRALWEEVQGVYITLGRRNHEMAFLREERL